MVVAGTTDQFKVIAHDANKNQLPTGGLNVTGSVEGPQEVTPDPFESFRICVQVSHIIQVTVDVADGSDGSYELSYTPEKIGNYTLTVSLDDTPIGAFND